MKKHNIIIVCITFCFIAQPFLNYTKDSSVVLKNLNSSTTEEKTWWQTFTQAVQTNSSKVFTGFKNFIGFQSKPIPQNNSQKEAISKPDIREIDQKEQKSVINLEDIKEEVQLQKKAAQEQAKKREKEIVEQEKVMHEKELQKAEEYKKRLQEEAENSMQIAEKQQITQTATPPLEQEAVLDLTKEPKQSFIGNFLEAPSSFIEEDPFQQKSALEEKKTTEVKKESPSQEDEKLLLKEIIASVQKQPILSDTAVQKKRLQITSKLKMAQKAGWWGSIFGTTEDQLKNNLKKSIQSALYNYEKKINDLGKLSLTIERPQGLEKINIQLDQIIQGDTVLETSQLSEKRKLEIVTLGYQLAILKDAYLQSSLITDAEYTIFEKQLTNLEERLLQNSTKLINYDISTYITNPIKSLITKYTQEAPEVCFNTHFIPPSLPLFIWQETLNNIISVSQIFSLEEVRLILNTLSEQFITFLQKIPDLWNTHSEKSLPKALHEPIRKYLVTYIQKNFIPLYTSIKNTTLEDNKELSSLLSQNFILYRQTTKLSQGIPISQPQDHFEKILHEKNNKPDMIYYFFEEVDKNVKEILDQILISLSKNNLFFIVNAEFFIGLISEVYLPRIKKWLAIFMYQNEQEKNTYQNTYYTTIANKIQSIQEKITPFLQVKVTELTSTLKQHRNTVLSSSIEKLKKEPNNKNNILLPEKEVESFIHSIYSYSHYAKDLLQYLFVMKQYIKTDTLQKEIKNSSVQVYAGILPLLHTFNELGEYIFSNLERITDSIEEKKYIQYAQTVGVLFDYLVATVNEIATTTHNYELIDKNKNKNFSQRAADYKAKLLKIISPSN